MSTFNKSFGKSSNIIIITHFMFSGNMVDNTF